MRFLKIGLSGLSILLATVGSGASSANLSWWRDARFGLFIHFGLYSLPARHEWVKSIERLDAAHYEERYFDRFDPDLLDAREWARQAKAAGMRYAVLTAKHHEGFCLFDSRYTDYKSTNTPFGRDLVREFLEAFRAEGLRVGLYYSLPDWHHPDFTVDRYHPQRPVDCGPWDLRGMQGPEEPWTELNEGRNMDRYREYLYGQVTELLTNYGKLDLLWFDFTMTGPRTKTPADWRAEDLLALVRRLQPGIVVNDRLGLPSGGDWGDFVTPEQQRQRKWVERDGRRVPWEMCQTFSGSWGYHRDQQGWKSPHELIDLLVSCVSHGGNLILNVGPTGRGRFDRRATERLSAIGEWMSVNARSVRGCTEAPAEFTAPPGTTLTWNPSLGRLYVHLTKYRAGALPLAFADRIAYAQFLHDASEIVMEGGALRLPKGKPDIEIPVVELFFKPLAGVPVVRRVGPGEDLRGALEELRAARGLSRRPAVLEFADGIYPVRDTLELDERDSGIVLRAAKGARPILDGGVRISSFRALDNGLSVADVPAEVPCREPFSAFGGIGVRTDRGVVDDLYRDGVLLTVAREPDDGFFRVDTVLDPTNFIFTCKALESLGIRDARDLSATGYWKFLWGDQTLALDAREGGRWHVAGERLHPVYASVSTNAPFFVRNHPKFIDMPDEWALDRENGRICVKSPASGTYVMPAATGPLLRLKSVRDAAVEGLSFRYGRGDGVVLSGCRNVRFEGNAVTRFGGTGLKCLGGGDVRIVGNRFATFGGKAAVLNGGDRASLAASGCVFADNDVSDAGRARRTYSQGLEVGGCGHRIVCNRFHDLSSSALRVGGNDHLIASNVVERVVMESDDQGGFDAWGSPFYRGIRIIHNVWRDIGGASARLPAPCGRAGVRFDDRISGVLVYGNLFDRCTEGIFGGVQINGGRENMITNNVFVGCRYGVSILGWTKEEWLAQWRPERFDGGRDVLSGEWKRRYGDLSRLRDLPMVNVIARNVVIGAEAVVRSDAPQGTVVADNFVFPSGTKPELVKPEGFAVLPDERALGPRTELVGDWRRNE